jgi:hypothetical protein
MLPKRKPNAGVLNQCAEWVCYDRAKWRHPSLSTLQLPNSIARLRDWDQQQRTSWRSPLADSERRKGEQTTVEDLLHYLPIRYEDRSSLARIRDLQDGAEASLELYVKLAGGYQVRNKRSFKQRLFIFEIAATDRERSGQDVVLDISFRATREK